MPGQSFTGFRMFQVQANMPGLGAWQGCEYIRVTQGAE